MIRPHEETPMRLWRRRVTVLAAAVLGLAGCLGPGGYSQQSLYPRSIHTVCLQLFDNRSFRRDIEYHLSDALAKRIEAETPYKLQSNAARADSLITGQILSIREAVLTVERDSGQALEKEWVVEAVVTWKNLKSGDLLLDNEPVTAAASYSPWLQQGAGYAGRLAAERLAQRIVEKMETPW